MASFVLESAWGRVKIGGMKCLQSLICVLVMMGGAAMAAPVSEAAKTAREAAREYGAAVRNCDMGWALDSMYPPLRRTYADQLSSRPAPRPPTPAVLWVLSASRKPRLRLA